MWPLMRFYDKFAIRIILQGSDRRTKSLYAWEKFIHRLLTHFTPKPCFGYVIGFPLPKNLPDIEALHITVMGPKGKWEKLQIRSERMHEDCEKGYAAHF